MIKNKKVHLFYEDPENEEHSPSCFMTNSRELGIQASGSTVVTELKAWMNSIKRENQYLERINRLEREVKFLKQK